MPEKIDQQAVPTDAEIDAGLKAANSGGYDEMPDDGVPDEFDPEIRAMWETRVGGEQDNTFPEQPPADNPDAPAEEDTPEVSEESSAETPEETPEEAEPELSPLEAQNQELLSALKEMLKGKSEPQAQPESKPESKPEKSEPQVESVTPETPKLPDQQLISEQEFDELLSSPDGYNKVMNRVGERMFQQMGQVMVDNISKQFGESIQPAMANMIQENMYRANLAQQFYTSNPDLQDEPEVCQWVETRIRAEHPDWDDQRILSETGEKTRRLLNRVKNPDTNPQPQKQGEARSQPQARPALAGGTGARPAKQPDMSNEQRELLELWNTRVGGERF